ncbi:phosphotransferase [Nonomuraea sp. NPDC050783]|uniref:phosphotransferase n=1 Tax=Nonomuraea sp. NPDC050783 TaxID=3154634 RepID=UPI003465C6FF
MPSPSDESLSTWCERNLGAPVTERLFERAHLSAVIGVRLHDGKRVVVKTRPHAERLVACHQVQHHLHRAGFPCPRPLVAPTPLDATIATAEEFVLGGSMLTGRDDMPELFAAALARLIATAPTVDTIGTLTPAPPWVGWDHDDERPWPRPDDLDADLNDHPAPAWLTEAAQRVRSRLTGTRLPPVVGHGDFESQNLRWDDSRLHVVHDWDSVVSLPEAAVAGAAAAVFKTTNASGAHTRIDETERFLAAYEAAGGGTWNQEERRVAWAAGVWVLAFNAKKESVRMPNGPGQRQLAGEITERLRRAQA